ncbi:hypothetical protein [Spirosoma aerophilum]
MKISHQRRLSLTALLFLSILFTTQAQKRNDIDIPRDGFWVVETTPKSRQCTVRFYTNDQRLIYQETVNQPININRQQTKRQLNSALEQAMFVWNATHQLPADRQWVSVQFDKK